jgi:hypothetical protein
LERPVGRRERAAHRGQRTALCGRQIDALGGVAREVEELGAQTLDQMPVAADDRRQVAPAEVDERVHRLGVDRPVGDGNAGVEKGDARQLAGAWNLQPCEDRRGDVDQADVAAYPLAGARAAGEFGHERHLDRLAVEQQAVLVLAVVAQPLAVVGEQDDQSPVVDSAPVELGEKPADEIVGSGDLAVVGVGVARLHHRRRAVRSVRLVEVQEEEERPLSDPIEKTQRRVDGLAAGPFGGAVDPGSARARGSGSCRCIVEVEAGGDPGALRQNLRRDGCASGVAQVAQALLQERGARRVDGETDVVAHAVRRRQEPGEERGVRRQCERGLGEGALEQQPIANQPVDRRRREVAAPRPRRQAVGPQGVDRDQHDGGTRGQLRRLGVRGRAAGGRAESGSEDCGKEKGCCNAALGHGRILSE